VLAWLYVWSLVQTCIWPSWCHCHSLSLASVKSRLVLPFWYWLTQVVLEKEPLNGCVCLCFLVYKIIMIIFVCCRVLQDIAWERWMWDWAKWSGWWTKSSSVGPTLLRLWFLILFYDAISSAVVFLIFVLVVFTHVNQKRTSCTEFYTNLCQTEVYYCYKILLLSFYRVQLYTCVSQKTSHT